MDSNEGPTQDRLDSWKRIANYLGRSVRTARRWESSEGLPVHRMAHGSGNTVFAYATELDSWRDCRSSEPQKPSTKENMKRPLLAVLPFDVYSDEEPVKFVGEALTEELTNDLATSGADIGVIARTTMKRYSQASHTINDIGRELGAHYVIEGSVQSGADTLRIIAQLIRTTDEIHLWSHRYDEAQGDLLEVQRQVAFDIASNSLGHLDRKHSLTPSPKPRLDKSDYRQFCRARALISQQHPESIVRACDILKDISQRYPKFAPAFAAHAQAIQLLCVMGCASPNSVMPEAMSLAMQGVAADSRCAEAYCALGLIQYCYCWDNDAAARSFQLALDVNPNLTDALQWRAELMSINGKHDKAKLLLNQAAELDPLSLSIECSRGFALSQARQFDEQVAIMQSVVQVEPGMPLALILLALGYNYCDAPGEAVSLLESRTELLSMVPDMLAIFGYSLAKSGKHQEAQKVLDTLVKNVNNSIGSRFQVAIVCVGLDLVDQAIDALEQAREERFWHMSILNTEPMFDCLRENSRFQRILADVGLRALSEGCQ